MLANWRLHLKAAEQALEAGRLDEALALCTRPEVAQRREARELLARLGRAWQQRARQQLDHGQSRAAWRDLRRAERIVEGTSDVIRLKQELMERGISEARGYLEREQPQAALDLVRQLREGQADSTELRAIERAANYWVEGQRQARRGRFAQAAEVFDRAAKLCENRVLVKHHEDLVRRAAEGEKLVKELHAALAACDWQGVLGSAERLLSLAPEHPEAAQARAKAWEQVGVRYSGSQRLGSTAGYGTAFESRQAAGTDSQGEDSEVPGRGRGGARSLSESAEEGAEMASAGERAAHPEPGPRGRFLLWVDGVGGFLVCLNSRVTIGQAIPDGHVDIPLLADVSRRHATVSREAEGYVLKAKRAASVNGRPIEETALADGDVVGLERGVRLRFRQPSPVSGTARLEFSSPHRLPLAVTAILLMAETCILGPGSQAHIRLKETNRQIVLYREGDALWCRTEGRFEVDGEGYEGRAPLTLQSAVRGEDFSFSLEPLSSRLVQV